MTIETEQAIRFRGELSDVRGLVPVPALAWESSGGSIDTAGTFSARRPGTYHVIGRGRGRIHGQRPDTSVVIVIPRLPGIVGIRVAPRQPKLAAGESRQFRAVGRLRNGKNADLGVVWSATGGQIDPDGTYRAGAAAGTYRVIGSNTRGTVADTVSVTITSMAPLPDTLPLPTDPTDPAPQPEPAPTVARVVLKPAAVVLATRATHQFAAFGRTAAGDSVVVDVTYHATGGTITPTGLYTAGQSAGTFRVIARSAAFADTSVVTLAATSGGGAPTPIPGPNPTPVPAPGGKGIPFGPTGGMLGKADDVGPFTMAVQGVTPGNILSYLSKARAAKASVNLNMTGGKHEQNFASGGDRFDLATWKRRMDAYNTPAIKQAVAAAVADGTIIGNSVMDEPHVHGGGDGNTHGPEGWMKKAVVDQMCGYVKAMFPTLPVGVAHRHNAFEPETPYRVCEFDITQYSSRLGTVAAFREGALAMARRDGISIIFSLNILNGGTQDKDGAWDCAGTGGKGTYAPNCRMTPAQIREVGMALGPAGCALLMWRYDERFMADPENRRAFDDIAAKLASLPRTSCRRK